VDVVVFVVGLKIVYVFWCVPRIFGCHYAWSAIPAVIPFVKKVLHDHGDLDHAPSCRKVSSIVEMDLILYSSDD